MKSLNYILFFVSILLVSCGGEEGDKTYVQGSEDSEARTEIASLETDVANLQTRTTDLENELAVAPISGVYIADALGTVYGRLIDTAAGSQFRALTSEGYIFYGNITSNSANSLLHLDMLFTSNDCTGPSYFGNDPNSFEYTNGRIIKSGDSNGPGIFYFGPSAPLIGISTGSRYTDSGCAIYTTNPTVSRTYTNDPLITGFPGFPATRFELK